MSPGKRKLVKSPEKDENEEYTDSDATFKVPRKDDCNQQGIDEQIREVTIRIKEKEDTLRKLNLVRMYRTKWETQDLDSVTAQWLKVSQESLEDLRTKVKNMSHEAGQEVTLVSLIQSLGLDPELLKLDEEEDCFHN